MRPLGAIGRTKRGGMGGMVDARELSLINGENS